jgi:hypothetical protein
METKAASKVLAEGAGQAEGAAKAFIAFQIAWNLFHSKWNRSREPTHRHCLLMLTDCNILANLADNPFSTFENSNPSSRVSIQPELFHDEA